ncbi:3'-5' exonuclease [Chitinophaga tropicalis]|uniref:DNA 3'-5' helicase n=1 Tax=Chitinophaga tropicalis TaxID=2683588 RepID=A0A7K1U6R0_9BACT|nr:3'-5' exonuclease [Chitinophaga tropicalis]MVT09976.1 AAA family ATPase [Chitinophaga tropicalis]
MNLTQEQAAIIKSSGNIKIVAVAGAGKTTTLIEYAKSRKGQRILYLAFNKTVKLEAEKKFAEKNLDHVRVETAHSLAFSYIVRGSGYTLKSEGYKVPEIVDILNLRGLRGKHTEYILANHINAYLSYFCNSAPAKVQDLDYEETVTDTEAKEFATKYKKDIQHQTRLFLDKMNKGEIPITHDFYLKKFQLSKPILPFDVILFDEGQDASGAMLDVFMSQPATKVLVGDTHQQIYAWRYAVNSLEKVNFPFFTLTNSFRFDQDIADLATYVINWKNFYSDQLELKITGHGKTGKGKTRAVVARTNAGLLVKAIELLIEKKEIRSLYFEGRIESYTYAGEGASIYDILNLHTGDRDRIRDKTIAGMSSMDELEDYIKSAGETQMGMLVEVVKKYGVKIPGYIKKLKDSHLDHDDKEKADMIFSTVHRCKGMEYDEVTLAGDFMSRDKVLKLSEGRDPVVLARLNEEINLLYVAITRARKHLYIPEEILTGVKAAPVAQKGTPKGKKISTYAYAGDGEKKQNANTNWTPSDDRRLEQLFNEGRPVPYLAKVFNRSNGAIAMRLKKLGVIG